MNRYVKAKCGAEIGQIGVSWRLCGVGVSLSSAELGGWLCTCGVSVCVGGGGGSWDVKN